MDLLDEALVTTGSDQLTTDQWSTHETNRGLVCLQNLLSDIRSDKTFALNVCTEAKCLTAPELRSDFDYRTESAFQCDFDSIQNISINSDVFRVQTF